MHVILLLGYRSSNAVIPVSIVHNYRVLGRACDAIVVLEEPQVLPSVFQLVRQILVQLQASCSGQAEEDLSSPAEVMATRDRGSAAGADMWCKSPLGATSSPEVGLQHSVEVLVERSGGKVAAPEVVIPGERGS